MKHCFFFTLMLLAALARGQGMLTLDDAIATARASSRMLKASGARAEAAAAKADEASAALFPALKLEASYKRLSYVDPFQIYFPSLFPTPYTISPTVQDNYAARIGLQQPLFTGFRLRSNARAAERLAEAGEADVKNDDADLVLTVTSAYWALYQAREVEVSVNENVRRLESFEKDVENLMKSGLATRNDLLKVRVQLSSARLMSIDAVNDAMLAAMNLNNVIGSSLSDSLRLASVPMAGLASVSSVHREGDPLALVLGTRPDLLAMRSRLDAARAAVSAAQGGWWPQLAFSANYYYSRPNPRFFPVRDEFKGTWDVGLGLQLDLWNWGMTAAQTNQAKAQVRQNEYLLSQMEDNARLDIRRQELGVRRALDKVALARLSVEQAEENLRMATDKFRNGMATSTELLDADVSLLAARTSSTGALVEHAVATARLARALGLNSPQVIR
jgi:outer membrane protein